MGRPEQRTPGHSRLPITGEVVGSVPEAVEADVDAARAAFDEPHRLAASGICGTR
jgi:acyl-CoA reductase-like NAD-dependent aldehyde dehydrogenase